MEVVEVGHWVLEEVEGQYCGPRHHHLILPLPEGADRDQASGWSMRHLTLVEWEEEGFAEHREGNLPSGLADGEQEN